jgi:hypothetical protein
VSLPDSEVDREVRQVEPTVKRSIETTLQYYRYAPDSTKTFTYKKVEFGMPNAVAVSLIQP